MDIHAQQIQGFFDCPVDNLLSMPVVVDCLRSKKMSKLTIVSPDTGGVPRAKELAKKMRATLVIIDKRRPVANVAKVYNVIGKVKGRNAVIIDDMIDTAGTLTEVSVALKKAGAESVCAACTHGLFSGNAIEKIQGSPIKEIFITDTINQPPRKKLNKIKVLSVASLLGEAISRIHNETSVSDLFI
jgi:ribose-phosphate pyrophosphokinase